MSFNKLIKKVRSLLRKGMKDEGVEAFIDFIDSKKLTTYSKEVEGTKLDPKNIKSKEYGKAIRYLTEEENKDLIKNKNLGLVENRGKARRNKKTQKYMERKNRQI